MVTGRLVPSVVLAVFAALAPVTAQQAANISSDTQTPVAPGNGVSTPIPILQREPKYPAAPEAATVKGEVWVEAVVLANGTVGQTKVTNSLDAKQTQNYGFDEEALKAARLWLFKPGAKDGQPIPVKITMILEFMPGSPGDQALWQSAQSVGAPGLVAPVMIHHELPKYTANAMRAKIEGEVVILAVVRPDGTVGATRVVRSLDRAYGLDEEARKAASAWIFTPGTLNGLAVPVRVTINVEFKIH